MKIIHQKTKTLTTRDNGRSADAISPNFVYGCLGGCMKSYCYVGRYNHDKVYINENTDEILLSIDRWAINKPWPKIPNQTDSTYYTIDIGCSTDVALMTKHYDWQKVFDFFNHTAEIKSTFATKYPSMFDPRKYILHKDKHRIRVSLMPQKYSDILEPGTDKIMDRLKSILRLQERMEVHINFSPIIYADGWLDEYRRLFKLMRFSGIKDVKCECIFLTYNIIQHERNAPVIDQMLWRPDIQEAKDSQYAPDNIRYEHNLKRQMVKDFTALYTEYFDPANIRYIF
jgi:spore photoproduct lyase